MKTCPQPHKESGKEEERHLRRCLDSRLVFQQTILPLSLGSQELETLIVTWSDCRSTDCCHHAVGWVPVVSFTPFLLLLLVSQSPYLKCRVVLNHCQGLLMEVGSRKEIKSLQNYKDFKCLKCHIKAGQQNGCVASDNRSKMVLS